MPIHKIFSSLVKVCMRLLLIQEFCSSCTLVTAFQPHSIISTRTPSFQNIHGGFLSTTSTATTCRLELANINDDPDIVVEVKDWKIEDFHAIQDTILSSLSTNQNDPNDMGDSTLSSFDPEGTVEVDCANPQTIQECYYGDDDDGDSGCFLVATTQINNEIVGTAGLIIGTQVQYLKNGSSLSTPERITGAVRRVCCQCPNAASASTTQRQQQAEFILEALLLEVERRALDNQVTELIILAYPKEKIYRPTAKLLKRLGYNPIPINLGGVAEQYEKQLRRGELLN